MLPNTHLGIDPAWCGTPRLLEPGRAVVSLTTLPAMAADAAGLVHGGFVFGLADYAAMLAVNDPFVVLSGAQVRFLAPVATGEALEAEARLEQGGPGRKRTVQVEVRRGERPVFSGRFDCVVLERHVLEGARS